MLTYANGKAPDTALKFIDGTHVTPDVYERVTALQAYAATVGREVHVIRLGGYTNLAEQKARRAGSNAASTVPVALAGSSTHGIYEPGRVDLGSTTTSYTEEWLEWLLTVAEEFGLVREWPGPPETSLYDPNHFVASKPITYAPPAPRRKKPSMIVLGLELSATDKRTYSLHDDGRMEHHEDARQAELACYDAGQTAPYWAGVDDFNRQLWVHGLRYELDAGMVASWPAGHTFRPSWMNPGRPTK